MAESDDREPQLRRLLVAARYRVEDATVGLLAYRPVDRRSLVIVAGSASPLEVEKVIPEESVHRTLVYPEEPGPAARGAAAEHGLEILVPETLGPALGEILLLPELSLGPIERSGAEEPPGPLETPLGSFPPGERIVRPRLGRSEAELIAGVEGFRYTMRLVPYYVAPYRVREKAPHGRTGATREYLVAVQGLNGRVEVWEAGDRELAGDLIEPHERLEPLVPDDRAREIAERRLKERHTVLVDHTEQHGGALVIERRRVPPGAEDLKVGAFALVHVPFWYVEGADGRVVIDAVSGARSEPENAAAVGI
ncbi:MAG TPA: hypothetical protein VGV89_00245 [Thermoplasmata archaeon]|nr:hypothetical protein [Thermoplasmata archaeon]